MFAHGPKLMNACGFSRSRSSSAGASRPSRWLQSTHSPQRLTNSSSLPALTRQLVCVYGFSISPSLGDRIVDDGTLQECGMPLVVADEPGGDTRPGSVDDDVPGLDRW